MNKTAIMKQIVGGLLVLLATYAVACVIREAVRGIDYYSLVEVVCFVSKLVVGYISIVILFALGVNLLRKK